MIIEIIQLKENATEIKLPIADDGFAMCPVCGEKSIHKNFRAYDSFGNPSFGICKCGIEYGYDCSAYSTQQSWDNYRLKWFNEELEFGNSKKMKQSQKIIQLKGINIEIK